MKKFILNSLILASLILSTSVSASEFSSLDPLGVSLPELKNERCAPNSSHESSEPTYSSWERLYSTYTDQSIENFQRGYNRGMFIVHSLEYIMGASRSFVKVWNKDHPDDQRTQSEGQFLHDVFTLDEFINNYDEYVVKERILVSGSVVAFNDEPQNTLAETFAPVSLIYKVPPECIVVTDIIDARTPVRYKSLHESEKELKIAIDSCHYPPERLMSLDTLVHYPWVIPGHNHLGTIVNDMNEVAFYSLARDSSGIFHEPQVAGVLINRRHKFTEPLDYGNSAKNQRTENAAIIFAQTKGLPVIQIDDTSIVSEFAEREAKLRMEECCKGEMDDFSELFLEYEMNRNNFLAADGRLKNYTFSSEALLKFGLRNSR